MFSIHNGAYESALYQAVVYLATAPKSNALYITEKKVKKEIRHSGSLPVPLHLRNAPTKLMRNIGYSEKYQYAHAAEDGLVPKNTSRRNVALRLLFVTV